MAQEGVLVRWSTGGGILLQHVKPGDMAGSPVINW